MVAHTVEANSHTSSVERQSTAALIRGDKSALDWILCARVVIALCTIIMASDALAFRWPISYCSSDINHLANTIVIFAIGGLLTGTIVGLLTSSRSLAGLSPGYAVASLSIQICPWLYWLTFDGRIHTQTVLVVLPFIGGAGLSLLFVWTIAHAVHATTPGKLLTELLSPGWIIVSALVLIALVALSIGTGSFLCAAIIGAVFLGLAGTRPMEGMSPNGSARYRHTFRSVLAIAMAATTANALLASRQLPAAVVRSSTHTIVHYERGRHLELRITSSQEAFHVFVGARLRFSTLDQNRWAQALTNPVLARSRCPKRALVLSQGEGLAERELLKESCIQSITSVVRDRVTVNAARRQPWWRQAIADAWRSPRVHVVESDPAVWLLEAPPSLFDIVIVDLPDPDNYINVKYYTRFFYREFRKRMEPSALMAIQATSALRSPRTFASIQATVRDAGYFTLAYRVAMTTLGEWSFILASPTNVSNMPRKDTAIVFEKPPSVSFSFPPDTVSGKDAQVSKLDDPVVLESFLEENGEDAP